MTANIVDLFAGMGGWSEALRRCWPESHRAEVGFEWERDACHTRITAGHRTIRADVATYPLNHFGQVVGLIASPPCQTFSAAGNGDGRDDLDRLVWHAHRGLPLETPDPRTGLVLEPLRWVHALQPRWVALEQVPAVAPVWHAYEHHLHTLGYATWSGVCNAADYGVPQTRRRAILLASLDRRPQRPRPSHERESGGLFDLPRWVSMADALGWSDPSQTMNTRGQRKTPGGNEFNIDRPSWALTEKARSWRLRSGSQDKATVRVLDAPAPALAFGHDAARYEWVVTGGVTSERYEPRPTTEPAPPITGAANTYVGTAEAFANGDVTEAVKLTVAEALILQDFPPDYPVQGSRTSQFQQVGNAIPVGLAAAVLAQVVG